MPRSLLTLRVISVSFVPFLQNILFLTPLTVSLVSPSLLFFPLFSLKEKNVHRVSIDFGCSPSPDRSVLFPSLADSERPVCFDLKY